MGLNRGNEFLTKLASLCVEYDADFFYTTADDGIHIHADGEEIFVGFLLDPSTELKEAIKMRG